MSGSGSFFGSFFGRVFSTLFGDVSWRAPAWLTRLKLSAKRQPLQFYSALLLLLAGIAALTGGYYYYQQLPKPLQVIASIEAPVIGDYIDDTEQPTPLTLRFEYDTPDTTDSAALTLPATPLSAARLDLIGEVITAGVSLSPALAGKWSWQDDNSLSFTPEQAWPAGTTYTVNLDNAIFAPNTRLAKRQYRFSTKDLAVDIEQLRFYQHPTEQATRQVVATLNFSHPVQLDSVKRSLSLLMRPSGADVNHKGQPLGFNLTADASGRQLYLQSDALSLPAQEQYLTLSLKRGVTAQKGSATTGQQLEQQLLIPDKSSFLKVAELKTAIVKNDAQEPEQVLLLGFTDRINRTELTQKLKLYQLPKHPRRSSNYWAPGEVTSAVLQQASLLDYQLMPTSEAHDSAFSIKLDLPPGQSLFVSLQKGLASFNDFTLANEYRAVVQAPQYPKEARINGEGALLTLSGEQTLQLLSRGVKGVRVSLNKLLPGELQHFISQSGGDISKPYFYNYEFDASNISHRFEKTFTLANSHAKAANYLALPLKPYLAEAGMGVFFIELTEFDPARPDDTGQTLDKRVVLVTDLGLLVKHNNDSSQQVFVMSLASGKPLAGAKVALLGKNGLPVLSGSTDEHGSVKLGKTNGFNRERQPVVYLVSHSANGISDASFIPYDRYSRQLDYSKFDTSGRYQYEQTDKALSAYMFSDRGIYRPGEQVQLAAIIRHNDLSAAAQQLPLRIQVQGPRGATFYQQNFSLSGRGLHSFSLETQPYSDTGNYHASISLLDKNGNASDYLGSVSFALEEFLPDSLKISSRFNQAPANDEPGWLSPTDLVAQVQLDNLFGTPAQQRRVSARFELIPSRFSFSQYPAHVFIAPQDENAEKAGRVRQSLDEQQTDVEGKARFALPLAQYSGGSYRLLLTTEGFDGAGGRSVQHISSALVSPLNSLVGVKTDGELSYLKKQQSRSVEFIAIDNRLAQVELDDLKLSLIEKRPLSSLVKQRDGTYQYQSIVQQVQLTETPFSIAATGSNYRLPTDTPGDFELQLHQGQQLLGTLSFSVVGEGNINAMLEKNAALSVKLDKTDYKAGDWIELNITAPYTGSGLISIESDKVHAFSWFNSNSTSSIQRIQLPEGIEGNAYINVSFVRAADSDALFVSPLSYAVVPFNIDRSRRKLAITLNAPEEVRPGKAFTVQYQSAQSADMLLYGVDEGILQVAGYKLPDPLSHYLQKRALQVRSMQMLDLLLPEFSLLKRQLAGVGGDNERMAMAAMMMDKNLNPFARRAEQPGVFWLGRLTAGPELKTAQVSLPESFSGNVKLMAVAVSDTALGSAVTDIRVRGPFVLTPDVLLSAAPGDEFDVSITVANGIKGSGAAAPVNVSLNLPANLSVIGPDQATLAISEGSEQSARFRLKAGPALGSVDLGFTAQYQQGGVTEQASRSVGISIRPASAYHTTLTAGYADKGPLSIDTRYPLYSEFAQLNVTASSNPLVLAEAFTDYLAQYPHGCTEQVVSQVFPWIGLVQQDAYQAQWPALNEKFAVLIQKLAERQQSDGGFSFWPGGYHSADFPSIYVMHFLLAAREQGLAVPDYLYQQGLDYLRGVARQSGANLYQARLRANAIYLLTRSGEVTTNYLTALHERLEKQHQQGWQSDITAVYMAATYQLLQQPALANGLLSGYRLGKPSGLQSQYLARIAQPLPPFANPAFQSQLSLDAQYVYLLASHFADKARALDGAQILQLLQPAFSGQYNTIASAYTVLALSAYAKLSADAEQTAPAFYQRLADGGEVQLSAADNQGAMPKVAFDHQATQIVLQSQQALFYALSEAGFAKTAPEKAVSAGLELVRDYLDSDGKLVTQARQGDELTVRLRLRSTDGQWHNNIALIDLLPAGFSIVRSSVARQSGPWRADYVDIREDRLVYYASFGSQMTELSYKVKLTAAGNFTLPTAQAQSMYDPAVHASTAAGRFVVDAR